MGMTKPYTLSDTVALVLKVFLRIYINDDVSRAENEVRTFMEAYYGMPYEKMAAI